MHTPHEISLNEWAEIIQLPEIRQDWGLRDETPEQFAEIVYGVRFTFEVGGPGYRGDLFILHGYMLGEAVTIIRENGKMQVVDFFRS